MGNKRFEKVCIVGLGYVGITLALTLAKKGFKVFGYDINKNLIESLERKKTYLFEPGIDELIKKHYGKNFVASSSFKNEKYAVIIICVSTPLNFASKKPDLSNLKKAVRRISKILSNATLVIVRSTVPVGTTRNLVSNTLRKINNTTEVAFCPERTIQGIALKELVELPQIVGGVDDKSASSACKFFSRVSKSTVKVNSSESAEMIKLINNCHTDLIYSFGNEIALMGEKFHLDPYELINAANSGYPRPNLNKPGFVGGGCLSKDPYILIESFSKNTYIPQLVLNARKLNENMPIHMASKVIMELKNLRKKLRICKIFICGLAYKGQPETDDMRGSPLPPFLETIKHNVGKIYGHDFLVSLEQIKNLRIEADDIASGFKDADCVIFLNNHQKYKKLKIAKLIATMKKPALIYDCWRLFDKDKLNAIEGIKYHSIGI